MLIGWLCWNWLPSDSISEFISADWASFSSDYKFTFSISWLWLDSLTVWSPPFWFSGMCEQAWFSSGTQVSLSPPVFEDIRFASFSDIPFYVQFYILCVSLSLEKLKVFLCGVLVCAWVLSFGPPFLVFCCPSVARLLKFKSKKDLGWSCSFSSDGDLCGFGASGCLRRVSGKDFNLLVVKLLS